MKKFLRKIPPAVLVCLVPYIMASCILDEKVLELVFTEQTTADFEHDSQSETFTDPETVDYADEIDKILAENGISKSKIRRAVIVSAAYEVTDFSHTHDWDIYGAILVERVDVAAGPDTLIRYSDQSVAGALGKKIPARLHPDGVDILHTAIRQYLADTHDPVIIFTVANSNVDPDPSSSDRIKFDWKGWLTMHILVEERMDAPDPF